MTNIGRWYKVRVCVECEEIIESNENANSGGICPHCGKNSGTSICETKEMVARAINIHPWWKFWSFAPIKFEKR